MATAGTTKDELKRRVFEAIDRRAEEIIGIGERIASNAEMGFKEVKTARLVQETLGRASRSRACGRTPAGTPATGRPSH